MLTRIKEETRGIGTSGEKKMKVQSSNEAPVSPTEIKPSAESILEPSAEMSTAPASNSHNPTAGSAAPMTDPEDNRAKRGRKQKAQSAVAAEGDEAKLRRQGLRAEAGELAGGNK
jgi:hypothetical protein